MLIKPLSWWRFDENTEIATDLSTVYIVRRSSERKFKVSQIIAGQWTRRDTRRTLAAAKDLANQYHAGKTNSISERD